MFGASFYCVHAIRSLIVVSRVDSGLSLTTARDATEIESEGESKSTGERTEYHGKAYRSLISKREADGTDSDEVFVEVRVSHGISLELISVRRERDNGKTRCF